MDTEKTEGADDSATETTPETGMDLGALAKSLSEQPEKQEASEPAKEAKEATPAEPDEYAQPPSALRPEYKAEWAKLDRKWREEIHRREKDFHKGIEPYKTGHSAYEKLQKEVLSPYMARIQASGLPPERFIQEFLTLDHVLATGTTAQKQQALAALQQYYGLNAQSQQPNQQQSQANPEIERLERELAELRGTLTQSQTVAQQREQQEAMSQIEAFKANPKNVYFDDVREHMAALISTGKAKDMSDAYEQACWANPNVRAALLKQQRETEEKQRIEEAKRKAADAKRAGFDVQAQGAAASGSQPLSLRQELAQRAGVQLNH